jgi:hypothetical protein
VQEVIELALQRAQRKGLDIQDTAELIVDFLDIAKVKESGSAGAVNIVMSNNAPKSDNRSVIEPPPFPIESVLTGQQGEAVWAQDDLLNSLSGHQWMFKCKIGVVIEFRCSLLPIDQMNLFPVFIGLSAKSIDPDAIKEDAKTQAMHMLKKRTSPVVPNTVPITNYPSEFALAGGRGGGGFGADAMNESQLQWEIGNIRQMSR